MVDIIQPNNSAFLNPEKDPSRKMEERFTIEDISKDDINDFTLTDAPKYDNQWLTPPPRAKTRLISRSHSVSDLSQEDACKMDIDCLRRNSSGNEDQQLCPHSNILIVKDRQHLSSMSTLNLKSSTPVSMNSKPSSPTLVVPNSHLSPISMHYQVHHQNWPDQTKMAPRQTDRFTVLLQTTAERVLCRLKSRQQDLGKTMQINRKLRKYPHGTLQSVPRKLQPILRDGAKTPQRSNSVNSDGKSDCEFNSPLGV